METTTETAPKDDLQVGKNEDIFTSSSTYYTIDNKGNHPESVFEDVRINGNESRGRADRTLGLTKKIFKPLWLNLGAGAGYQLTLWEVDEYSSSGNFEGSEWVKNTDESYFRPVVEVGILLDLWSVVLNYTLKKYDFDSDFGHLVHRLGVGFSF